MSDFLTGDLTNWVIDVIDALGYPGVALLTFLENVFPPIPSEVVLPAAGIHSRDGRSALWAMIVAATIGSVVGAWFLYGFAAWIGPVRLRGFVVRRGRWFALKETDLDKAEAWFDRRHAAAVLLCRCVPLVRSLVSIPAGFRHMNLARFTIYTAIGSLVWNGTLITLGYAARQHWDRVQDVMSWVQYGVVAVALGVVGLFLWRRVLRPARRSDGDRPATVPGDGAARRHHEAPAARDQSRDRDDQRA